MAVQKSRVSRSKRGMRRAHDGLTQSALSVDRSTGETHRRHHVSPEGYYKGRLIVNQAEVTEEKEGDEE